MAVAPQFIWLVLLPSNAIEYRESISFSRLFLAFLAVNELLGAYPNAGTQQAIGLVLPTCVALICLFDGIRRLTVEVEKNGARLVTPR